MTMQSTKTW